MEMTQAEWDALVAEWVDKNGRNPNLEELAEIEADAVKAGSGKTQEEQDRAAAAAKIAQTDSQLAAYSKNKFAPTDLAGLGPDKPSRQIATGSAQLAERFTEYTGPFLVDENGRKTTDTLTDITTSNDSTVLFFQELQESGQAQAFIQDLFKRGFYQGRKPSDLTLAGNGLGDTDLNAIQTYIYQANQKGLTPKAYMKDMMALPAAASTSGASGPSITTTEAVRYLREESFAQLGRPLTGPEIAAAVSFVKSQVAGKVSPDVAAQERVLTTNSQEASVYSLGLALKDMFA